MNRLAIWIKQVLVLLMVLVIILAAPGLAYAANRDQYKSMTGEEKFTEIKEQVTHSALSVSRYKAADAYKEITDALSDLKKLHTLVMKADHVDSVIDKVSDGLDRIASAYEEVAGLSSTMSQYRKGEFTYLQSVNGETLKTQNQLKQEISKLESENRLLKQKIEGITDDIEKKKIEISLRGNGSIISSLEAQRIIWDKFYLAQKKLLESLELNGRQIDLLLHVLDVNAKVYSEAANVARLRRSAKSALENLGSLADIQSVIGDLQDSWLQVDDIVSEISKADFAIDIQ